MSAGTKPGVYIHLPFCAVHCSYCDFPITTRRALASRYFTALRKEIEMNPADMPADTLYYGGGTPSLTPASVLNDLRSLFPLDPGSEITLEANPDDITDSSIRAWLETGINRISIGIQSLEDRVLRSFLRTHSGDEAQDAIRTASSAGCMNLNVDLILGAPQQTRDGFLEGLKRLLDLGPQHFSLYLLEVHETTLLARQLREGKAALMTEESQLICYRTAADLLNAAGYIHYEVSNFALPGFESRHNLKYWSDSPFYAYGAGASSYLPPHRTRNLSSVSDYIKALEEGRLPVESREEEDADTRTRNALIFGLRRTEGVDVREFEEQYHVSPGRLFGDHLQSYLDAGWLEEGNDRLRLTFSGMLLSNEILAAIV